MPTGDGLVHSLPCHPWGWRLAHLTATLLSRWTRRDGLAHPSGSSPEPHPMSSDAHGADEGGSLLGAAVLTGLGRQLPPLCSLRAWTPSFCCILEQTDPVPASHLSDGARLQLTCSLGTADEGPSVENVTLGGSPHCLLRTPGPACPQRMLQAVKSSHPPSCQRAFPAATENAWQAPSGDQAHPVPASRASPAPRAPRRPPAREDHVSLLADSQKPLTNARGPPRLRALQPPDTGV